MKTSFVTLLLCFLSLFLFAQDHILIDCIHGANYTTSYMGAQPINFHEIFPNSVLTIMTPDSLQDLTPLIDNDFAAGQHTFIVNLPAITLPEEVQTLYIMVHDDSGLLLNGIFGNITHSGSGDTYLLYNGFGHVDGAYGDGWQIYINMPANAHVFVGYGSTVFEAPAQYGHYDLDDYDAVLRIYDNTYIAYISESTSYSDPDLGAISNAFSNGLSFFYVYNYLNTLVDKPFVHMYTTKEIPASIWFEVPGTRTLAQPTPEGNDHSFGWKNVNLVPQSMNEHVYEAALHQKMNLLDFSTSMEHVEVTNRVDSSLYDLILLKKLGHQFEIAEQSVLESGKTYQSLAWTTYSLLDARKHLQDELYKQSIATGLSQAEAFHFVFELPWVDVMLQRANQAPDQYFCFYHFDNELYDRLIPLKVNPSPSVLERNMWVMLSNIQPRDPEPVINLLPRRNSLDDSYVKADFTYREYGMVDERYCIRNSTRDDEFFGITYYNWSMFPQQIVFYPTSFADELAGYASSFSFPYGYVNFTIDQPSVWGVFSDQYYMEHPICAAKTVSETGRLLVLGSSFQFSDSNQHPFLNAAMNSLIHSPHLGTDIHEPFISPDCRVVLQNTPNPFNPETTIDFTLPKSGMVEINLYNLKGQLIKHLLYENCGPGKHTVTWNGLNDKNTPIASQVLLCRMSYMGKNFTRKMVLLK